MSKQAMCDAFMAGWHYASLSRHKSKVLAENHFEAWYRNSVETGNRKVADVSVWIDEAPAAFTETALAKIEETMHGTTNRELLKQEIGKRATNILLGDEDRPPPYTVEDAPRGKRVRRKGKK